MQRLFRKRKGISPPGKPPYSHEGSLRNYVYFGIAGEQLVVGPAISNKVYFGKDRKPVRGTVPKVLNDGGQITVLEVKSGGKWKRADLRSRRRLAGQQTRYRTANVKARPFKQPTLLATRKKLPECWRDSIKAT